MMKLRTLSSNFFLFRKSVRKDYPYNFPKSYIIDRQINRSEKEYEYNLSKAKCISN